MSASSKNVSCRNRLRKLLAELISIKTYYKNPEIVSFLKKALKNNGWKNIKESGGNVWGRIGRGKTVVIYDVHSDTIRADERLWQFAPFKATFRKGFIYGRGAADDKGPLAAAIYSGNFIRGSAGYTVYLLVSTKEETDEGWGFRFFRREEKVKPDFAVISEPSGLKLALGQRGRVEVIFDIPGVPAHASMPEKGKNALDLMSASLREVKKIKFRKIKPFSLTTITPTVVSTTGDGKNVLPNRCRVFFDVRINHRDTVQSIVKKISDVTRRRGIKIKTGKFCPAWVLKNKVLLTASRAAYRQVFGTFPKPFYWKFCTNGSEYAASGIPVIGFGPGDPAMAHKRDEKIKFSDVEKAVGFFAALPEYIGSVK